MRPHSISANRNWVKSYKRIVVIDLLPFVGYCLNIDLNYFESLEKLQCFLVLEEIKSLVPRSKMLK